MNLDVAKLIADDLLGQWPALAGWSMEISPRLGRTLGKCVHRRKVIVLGQGFVLLNGVPQVAECIRHEIAHALTPGRGHDKVWKAMAERVGCKPLRCADQEGVVMPPGRFVAVCRSCGDHVHMYGEPRPNFRRWCVRCGREDGRLTFAPR